MFKISTAVRNALLGASGLTTSLTTTIGAEIRIFAGAEPATADAATGAATLLCVITPDGSGTGNLAFDAAISSGVLLKDSTQIWLGTNVASGTATFYRMVDHADTNIESTTAIRVQGSVGVVNADLLLASTALSISAEQRIDYFAIGMPSS